MSNARDIALRALGDRQGNISAHLERLLNQEPLSPADRGLARELTLGVIRRKSTLDAIAQAYLKHPGKNLPRALRQILCLAIYQILFLQRIPDFAVVDQAVSQARRRFPRQTGLVNAVLRSLLRELDAEVVVQAAPDTSIVPLPAHTGRKLTRAIFPDPTEQPVEYLAMAYSLPAELAQRWIKEFGFANALSLAAQSCSHPPLICRPNALRTDTAGLMAALAQEGMTARPHANGLSVVLESAGNLMTGEAFRQGLFQPQDATATSLVAHLPVQPGMTVLDFCAAPGTKTTHLAERMGNEGRIVACDVTAEKLARINENCDRLGVSIVETMLATDAGRLTPRSFDLVLVDAPCSNTGVLARRPEARWRFSATELSRMVRDQQFLAIAAGAFVAPGGTLVYSTCSIESEEDQNVATWLEKRCEHLHLVNAKRTLPAGADDPIQWRDGGFVAILEGR